MVAIKAKLDGRRVILPQELPDVEPGEVILIFKESGAGVEASAWQRVQESAFASVWENDEDAVYDAL